ncbi:MAG: hypothetical protein E7049_08375 [Lentisphaerae bacterium]|nr:hypothetical protein [Lentisphaerota bacterium]
MVLAIAALLASLLAAEPARETAGHVAAIEGVVLRIQPVRSAGDRPLSRLLLSTADGLCAVSVPGGPDEWSGYVDAEVEISGVMEGLEFIVSSESDVQILKYPPTDPDALVDALPAGEMVRRAMMRRKAEQDRKARVRAVVAVTLISVSVIAVLFLLTYFILRSRRKARFLVNRLATERRRTGRLHESIEQQLSGSRYLLETAQECGEGTPKEVSETMSTVIDALSDINRKVHRNNSIRMSVAEMRRSK